MSDLFSDVQSVFHNRDVLDESYQPDEILERDDEIEEYVNALRPVIKGWKANNVFVYGKTGVGKTAVTKYVTNELKETVSEKPELNELTVIWHNCNGDTAYETIRRLVNEIRSDDRPNFPKGHSTSRTLEELYREIETLGGTVLFVLDEIDHIKNADELLYDLPRAQANGKIDETNIVLIGISNDYKFRETLSPKTKDTLMEKEIKFSPYDALELQTILRQRVEVALREGVLEDSVLNKCAALAANDKGSARQAIDLLRQACDIADDATEGIVEDRHIEKAQAVLERGRVENSISDLTPQGTYVLTAVANAERQGETPIRSKNVYSYYESVAREEGANVISNRSVRNHLSDLSMLGFLETSKRNRGRSGGQYNMYQLTITPDSIFQSLGNQSLE